MAIILAAAIAYMLIRCQMSAAAILSASSLQQCVASSATDISCSKKMVVTVSVGNGQNLATQNLNFQLACVGSSTGSCPCPCNYALDPTCTCRDLASPLSITVTKTPMWATYPLQYLQSFNYKPYEVVVRPSSRSCTDGDYEANPTCGWYYVRGAKVSDSQGFTCQCSTSQIFDSTFGGSNQRTRANLDCDFWSDPLDILTGKIPCSAHCLQFDPLWYSGYQLGSASLYMTINVNINMPNGTRNTTTTEVMQLSPSVPLALSSSKMVSAQLLGDLATYTQLPVLSNMVLLIPQPSGATPDQILNSNRSTWLLVDPSMVSYDGNACDKVGTSFTAFRFQASGCSRAPQVCLSSQIKDLVDADNLRVQGGKVPLYMVTRYTYGSNTTLASFGQGPISFALPVTSTSTSLVVLSVSADSVQFTVNVATGVINSAALCTFAATTCGGFEAGASRGYIWLNVTNTGSLAADFVITINNCTGNVLPIEAQTVSLPPKTPRLITPPIPLYVTDSQADPNRSCWVTLYDSQGRVSDRTMLQFYTNATVFSDNPTGGYNGTGDGVGEAKGAVDCSKVCNNAVDVLCFVANGCWGRFGGFLGILTGVGGALALLVLAAKAGVLASLCSSVAAKMPCGGAGGGAPSGGAGSTNTAAQHSTSKATAAMGGTAMAPHGMHYDKAKGLDTNRLRGSSFYAAPHQSDMRHATPRVSQQHTAAGAPWLLHPPAQTVSRGLDTIAHIHPQQRAPYPPGRPAELGPRPQGAVIGPPYMQFLSPHVSPRRETAGSEIRRARSMSRLHHPAPQGVGGRNDNSTNSHDNPLFDSTSRG